MNPAERAEVAAALALSGEELAAAVERFTTREQLHQWLLHYNVNDGFLPCLALARHPRLDGGTAHRLFWQFHELLGDSEARIAAQSESPSWNADAVLTIVEDRFARDDFRSTDFHFDPAAWLQLTSAQTEELADAGLPPERMAALGHERIEREEFEL